MKKNSDNGYNPSSKRLCLNPQRSNNTLPPSSTSQNTVQTVITNAILPQTVSVQHHCHIPPSNHHEDIHNNASDILPKTSQQKEQQRQQQQQRQWQQQQQQKQQSINHQVLQLNTTDQQRQQQHTPNRAQITRRQQCSDVEMGQQEVDDTETEPPDALNLSSSQDDERSSVNDGSISLQSTSVSSVPGTTFCEGLSDSDKVKEYVGTTLFKKVKFITDENDLEIHGGKKIFYCAMFLVTFSSQPC
jgi:hypothetical protein